jgi:hypothetical protein
MEWTSGTFLWSMIGLVYWITILWMLVVVMGDIFRRGMSGWAKAGWIALIVLMPFVGILIYVVAMPDSRRNREAEEVAQAAHLHDRQKVSADAFEQLRSPR